MIQQRARIYVYVEDKEKMQAVRQRYFNPRDQKWRLESFAEVIHRELAVFLRGDVPRESKGDVIL